MGTDVLIADFGQQIGNVISRLLFFDFFFGGIWSENKLLNRWLVIWYLFKRRHCVLLTLKNRHFCDGLPCWFMKYVYTAKEPPLEVRVNQYLLKQVAVDMRRNIHPAPIACQQVP